MLAMVALYMHGHHGLNTKADILYHRGEALQRVHRGLANIMTADSSALLATVTVLAAFEVWINSIIR